MLTLTQSVVLKTMEDTKPYGIGPTILYIYTTTLINNKSLGCAGVWGCGGEQLPPPSEKKIKNRGEMWCPGNG